MSGIVLDCVVLFNWVITDESNDAMNWSFIENGFCSWDLLQVVALLLFLLSSSNVRSSASSSMHSSFLFDDDRYDVWDGVCDVDDDDESNNLTSVGFSVSVAAFALVLALVLAFAFAFAVFVQDNSDVSSLFKAVVLLICADNDDTIVATISSILLGDAHVTDIDGCVAFVSRGALLLQRFMIGISFALMFNNSAISALFLRLLLVLLLVLLLLPLLLRVSSQLHSSPHHPMIVSNNACVRVAISSINANMYARDDSILFK